MEFLHRLFYTAVGTISLLVFIIKIAHSHWRNRGILHEKPQFFWGNMKGVGKKRCLAYAVQEIYDKYKSKSPFIGFYVILKPMLLILDLELIKQILVTQSNNFVDRGFYNNVAADPLSYNLMQLDGDDCRRLRLTLQPLFSAEILKKLTPIMFQVANSYKGALLSKPSKVYAINKLVDCFNMDIIGRLAFGLDCDSLNYNDSEFHIMTRSYLQDFNIFKAYFAWHFPNMARLCEYRIYNQIASDYFLKLTYDKIKERESERSQKSIDFLSIIIELKRQSENVVALDNAKIAAQLFSFICIGLPAYNSTLTFCLHELALNIEVQEKAQDEIKAVLRKNDNKFDADCLSEMKYLKQILYETLRKYPPFPVLLRNTLNDYEIPDTTFMFKSDNHLIIPVHAIQNDPEIYAEPYKFNPARFSSDSKEPLPFMPFGIGPRNCIAQQLAEMQLLLGLVTLLRQFKFTACEESQKHLEYDTTTLILMPKGDVKLHLQHQLDY